MAIVEEQYRSVTGSQQTIQIGYLVSDALDASDAIAAVRFESPTEYGTRDELGNNYFRANVDVAEIEIIDDTAPINQYRCTVTYEYRYRCPLLTYDFTGANVRVTQSESTVNEYTRWQLSEDPRDFNQAIEVSQTGDVQGADAIRPGGEMVLLWHPPNEIDVDGTPTTLKWDVAYFRKINSYVGGINNQAVDEKWYGWDAFQVLLTGIVVNYLTHERQWEIEFRFAIGETTSWSNGGLIPGIESGEAHPHDVVWFTRKKASGSRGTGGDYQAPEVLQVNVERIAKQFDFENLFIPSNNPAVWGLAGCPSPPHWPDPIPPPEPE